MTEKTSPEACLERAKITNDRRFRVKEDKKGIKAKKPPGIPDGLRRLQGVFRLFNGLLQLT